MISDWMIGTSVHLLGDQAEAERRCRSAATAPAKQRLLVPHYAGFDDRIRGLVGLARVLWLVGRADEATRVAHQTIREAEALRHPVSLAIALVWTSSVFLWSGDLDTASSVIDRLTVHADNHALGPYLHVGIGLRGELAVARGNAAEAVALLRQAREALDKHHHGILDTVFATAHAQALAQLGHTAAAVAEIERALAIAARKGGSFDLPEMLRVHGALLATASPDAAERCWRDAIEVAQLHGALGWELRAATSLARHWLARGRDDDACALLGATLARFPDGADTADRIAARAVLSGARPAALSDD